MFTRFFYYIGNAIIDLRKCIKSPGIKGIGEAEKNTNKIITLKGGISTCFSYSFFKIWMRILKHPIL